MGRVEALAPRLEVDDDAEHVAVAESSPTSPALVRMRALSALLGAREFSLFAVMATADTVRLAPMLDSASPRVSALTRLCSGQQSEAFAKAALASTIPAIWRSGDAEAEGQPESRWTRRIAPPAAGFGGIAFPMLAERGSGGLAVFASPRTLDDRTICDAHLECFALFKKAGQAKPACMAGEPKLSKRELECLKLTADGLTSDQIAARLGLSAHTANQYLANTAQKLNAVNRMHAVAKALRGGLFD